MTYEDDGLLANALDLFRNLVAASATFQSLVSAENATQAKDRIILGGVDEFDAGGLPVHLFPETAEITLRIAEGGNITGTGNSGFTLEGLTIRMLLEIPLPNAVPQPYRSKYFWALRQDGLILREILRECRANPSLYADIDSIDNSLPMDIHPFSETNNRPIAVSERVFKCRGSAV